MLDLKFLRDNPGALKAMLEKRGVQNPWKGETSGLDLEGFAALDQAARALTTETEKLRSRRNQISEEFAKLKKSGGDTSALSAEMETLKKGLQDLEARQLEAGQKMTDALLRIPNAPHDSVPLGKSAEDNKVVRTHGTPTEFPFAPKQHWELGEALGILDFAAAGKISGSRFTVLRGQGAALERAIISFMLDLHTGEHGYTEIFAPYLVKPEVMQGTGQLPKFEEELFRLERDNLYLIPTAEVSVTNLHRDDVFDGKNLPVKYACYSACFRREAGSYGKDTKGLIRNHQFNKVELVWFTSPEKSFEDLEKLTGDAENVLKKLGIPYRVVLLSTGDMGFSSAKTYDLEVWMPGEKGWREISSCSCFTDFQARRMNIKHKNAEGKKELVHTLNGSGVAVGRLFAAILENYQQADGSIAVPEALRPYLRTDRLAR
jgi:seryl-tRNA synthetase